MPFAPENQQGVRGSQEIVAADRFPTKEIGYHPGREIGTIETNELRRVSELERFVLKSLISSQDAGVSILPGEASVTKRLSPTVSLNDNPIRQRFWATMGAVA